MSETSRVAEHWRSSENEVICDAVEVFRQKLADSEAQSGCDWGINASVGIVEGQWCVAIRVAEQDTVAVAEYFASAFIPGTPVDIQYVGTIHAAGDS